MTDVPNPAPPTNPPVSSPLQEAAIGLGCLPLTITLDPNWIILISWPAGTSYMARRSLLKQVRLTFKAMSISLPGNLSLQLEPSYLVVTYLSPGNPYSELQLLY